MFDPREVAHALSGDVTGRNNVLVPGPGHSRTDRSLSIKLDPAAPDGFVVYSFAGDDPLFCRNYVLASLGISSPSVGNHKFPSRQRASGRLGTSREASSELALRLWNGSHHPRGTIVQDYLASRGLRLPEEMAGNVIRFHPALALDGLRVGAMVALFRDIRTNEPCGIHRTFLDATGRKLGRKMLGRAAGAAIKLDDDADVTLGLHIGEGIESSLAAWLSGFRPVWALGSVNAIAAFPVLSGIEAITVLGETGDAGANERAAQACATRWVSEGRDAFVVIPQVGTDLNDAWLEAVS